MSSRAMIASHGQMVFLGGTISNSHVQVLVEFLAGLKPKQRGTVLINSEGGCEIAGFALYDMMHRYRRQLTTVAVGQVQSAAILPFLACDRRLTASNTAFMIHHGTYRLPTAEPQMEVPKIAEELVRLDIQYSKIIAERTDEDVATVRKRMRFGHYFDAEEALRLGFATGRYK